MTITDETTTEQVHHARAHLTLNPATIDAARVGVSSLVNGGASDLVRLDLPGMTMQSYDCDPLDVAAAFSRLSERIANAVLDHRMQAAS